MCVCVLSFKQNLSQNLCLLCACSHCTGRGLWFMAKRAMRAAILHGMVDVHRSLTLYGKNGFVVTSNTALKTVQTEF